MIVNLPKSDRRMMADVASLFQNSIAAQDLGPDNALDFWRISMYAKVGLLKKDDVRRILHAMEGLAEVLKRNPRKDPTGAYRDLPNVIERLRELMKRKNVPEDDDDLFDINLEQ
ncbi:MAG: hypothetical protein MJ086_01005 [Lachnospiraceae bacterium]|nr:hypothetical protein [Lachnospiraceae bacterium]